MSRLLIAVKSCHRDRALGFHDAIRSTWARDFGPNATLKCFVGLEPNQQPLMGHPSGSAINLSSHEVLLDCPDDYMSLPFKTREICRWSLSRLFDYIFLCDCDTYVNAKKLMALPYEFYDYSGYFSRNEAMGETFYYRDHMGEYPECYPWASGGVGYFLSKRAAYEIADTYPKVWAEDMYVGQIIGAHVRRGDLSAGKLSMEGAAEHFRKTKKLPEFKVEMVYRAHKDGGFQGIYNENA